MNQELLNDYKTWHHLQVETLDIDPTYPLLRRLSERWELTKDQRVWLCVCHVALYHVGSTLTMFERFSGADELPETAEGLAASGVLALPTGIERRGHRADPPLIKHLQGLRRDLGATPWDWFGANGWDWESLTARITELQGNGRWAAYKLAELLEKVAGVPTHATNAGHRYSSGPRKGLRHLYDGIPEGQDDATIAVLNEVTTGLQRWVGEPDVALIETSLCDFNSLVGGRFYIGHDIDSMQSHLLHKDVSPPSVAWEARAEVFDAGLLGEEQGWVGVQNPLKRAYRDQGVLDTRTIR